ncbi:UDP-N-acetylmuramate dehydrogenase [Candidatus Peregrinibacteria bacterium]|nr:UDP-N-acetylmuramate dehydrogenase [Candidatus Peregrinibacteria bacterium]
MAHLDQIEGIKRNVELAKFTTFQMGGPADYYYEVKDVLKIPELIEACRKDGLPYVLLGWGSNVIFSDKGFRGLIIHNLARKCELGEVVEQVGQEGENYYRKAGQLVIADSGTLLSQIIQFSLKNSLTGMEKLMGLPGTIGGAVRGNAGAFGLETKHLFEKATIYKEGEGVREVGWDYLDFDYRHSRIKDSHEIVLKVWLRLMPGDTRAGVEEVRKIIASRAGKHPSGKSAGSFFKNPSGNSIGEGLSAGYLNDQCGFKGKHIGGAFISEKHGNFLMNDGNATMLDVLELCLEIQKAVWEKFEVKLQREVALVGEHGYIEDEFAKSK